MGKTKTIGRGEILAARETLKRYKQGKANLENRIVENEQWYKMRHWECMRRAKSEVEPASGWLFNAIANKHADAMDNIPSANVLPREESDKDEAKHLSDIIPAILEQNNFESVYDDASWYLYVTGTTAYGTFWDAQKHNGLGDISIKRIDIRNLYYEPGKTDIQDSKNVFHVKYATIIVVEKRIEVESYGKNRNRRTTTSSGTW